MISRSCLSPTPSVLSVDSVDASNSYQGVTLRRSSPVNTRPVNVPIYPRPSYGSPEIQRQRSSLIIPADVMVQSNDTRAGIPLANIQRYRNRGRGIPYSLPNPDEQHKGEALLYAMSALYREMLQNFPKSGREDPGFPSYSQLRRSIRLAGDYYARKQMIEGLNAYELAQGLFEDMVKKSSPWLATTVSSLLTDLLTNLRKEVMAYQISVSVQFVNFISAYALQICPDHPIGYLFAVTSESFDFQRQIFIKILELFNNLSHESRSEPGMISRQHQFWRIGLLECGIYDEAERMLLNSQTTSDLESKPDLYHQCTTTAQRIRHIDILLRFCKHKRDYSWILFWCKEMFSLPNCPEAWICRARRRAAFAHEQMGNIGLAMVEATSALNLATGRGERTLQLFHSLEIVARLQKKVAKKIQDGYQWYPVPGCNPLPY